MKADEFCEYYFKSPGDVYAKYNEFISETGSEISFEEFQECIDIVNKLNTVDEYILEKFLNYLEVKKDV